MKKKFFAASIICAAIILLIIGYKYEKKSQALRVRLTLEYTDEQILAGGYFDILASADENRHLPSDVISYSLGDGFIHLVLPGQVNDNAVVCYIRDENGAYLARRVYDFTNPVMIGDWQVVLDRSTIPTLYFEADEPGKFDKMCESPVGQEICYGNMQIYVDPETAEKCGWYTEYISLESDFSTPFTASLQGRGQSSFSCDSKKSFTLRLEKGMSLLGMPKADAFNLVGNAYDPSLIKNVTFNKLAEEVGIKYQPQMQNINLYVDGIYQGVYTLTTKVTVAKSRVNLSKGDYLYKMDSPTQLQPLLYSSKTWFEDGLSYPVADLLYPENASDEELCKAQEKLQEMIDAMECGYESENGLSYEKDLKCDAEDVNAAEAEKYPDAAEGVKLSEVVDLDSLARYYWVEEASMNFDAWQRSVYIYYDHKDKKMHFGPVWDMDLTLGSPYEKEGMTFTEPYGFKVRNAGYYKALFENSEFTEAVRDVYENGGVREALIGLREEFFRQKESLGEDAYLNWTMFGHANMGTTLMYGESFDEYCDNMIRFYEERINWLDEAMK